MKGTSLLINRQLWVLKRGYTYIKDLKNNLFIKSAKNIKENANLKISFYDGNIKAIAKKK